MQSHELQHNRLSFPSLSSWVCSNSCPLSRWCHPPISSCRPLLLLPSIFPSTRVFSNESVLRIRWPKYWSFNFNISPFNEYSGLISWRWTGWISLQSKGLSRVFSNTKVQKHQFFGTQLSSQSNSHIRTWPLDCSITVSKNKTRSWLWFRPWTPYYKVRLKLKNTEKITRPIKSLMIIQWKWQIDSRD